MTKVQDEFAAQLLQVSGTALAAQAVRVLFEKRPSCLHRYQPSAEAKWRRTIESRLIDLAAALATGDDQVFVDQVAWAKAAFMVRVGEEGVEDLRASLSALNEVIGEELPPPQATACSSVILRASDRLSSAADYVPSRLSTHTPYGKLAAAYLLSILQGDRYAASQMIMSAAEGGSPGLPRLTVRELFELVLMPAQEELGRMWHMNESTVGEEHFATSTTQMVVSMLYPYHVRRERNGLTVVSGSVEGNSHEIGIRMLADLLEAEGWRVIFLGANVPAEEFAEAVEGFSASLAAVSASLAVQIPQVTATVREIRSRTRGRRVPVLIGGSAFGGSGDLWRSTGADGFARDLQRGLAVAAELAEPPSGPSA